MPKNLPDWVYDAVLACDDKALATLAGDATLPWGEKYIGQTQKWFAFKFKGQDHDINVETQNPEFSEWKWVNKNSMANNIVPFKKKVYYKILEEFNDLF